MLAVTDPATARHRDGASGRSVGAWFRSSVVPAVHHHGGSIAHARPESILAVFHSAHGAAGCALAIHRSLSR